MRPDRTSRTITSFLEAEFLALGIAAAGFEEGFPKFTAPFCWFICHGR